MKTNPAVEQSKIIRWSGVRGISPAGKEKVPGGMDLLKSQVLSSVQCWLVTV